MSTTRDLLRDVFSFSKLTVFAQCPRKFFYRYVVRMKAPPSEPQIKGRGTHAGQEYDNLERVAGRKPGLGEVLDAAVVAYESEGGVEVDRFTAEHREQLAAYHQSGYRDRLQPVKGTVEMPFEVELRCTADPDSEEKRPAVVQGFLDVKAVDEATRLVGPVDYKTVQRKMTDADAQDNLQMKLYQLGSESEKGWFVNFIRFKKQKPTTIVSPVRSLNSGKMQQLLTFLNDTITSVWKNLRSGDFPKCAPACWWCSKQACEFFDQCYPEKDPQLPRFVSIEEVRPVGTLESPEWRKKKPDATARD